MSAQGVLNWPNGVRQITHLGVADTVTEGTVTFKTVPSSAADYSVTFEPSSAHRTFTFDHKYKQIVVEFGSLTETFTLDDTNRASVLVYFEKAVSFVKHFYDADFDWPGSLIAINTLSEDIKMTQDFDGPNEAEVTLAANSEYYWPTPMGQTLPDRNDLEDWTNFPSSEASSNYLLKRHNGSSWVIYSDNFYPFWLQFLHIQILYLNGSTRSLWSSTVNLLQYSGVNPFLQWRWQYFTPALTL